MNYKDWRSDKRDLESNIIHRVPHSQLYGGFTENTIQMNHESKHLYIYFFLRDIIDMAHPEFHS